MGRFDLCHPTPVCTVGSKKADFRSQWQVYPGTLESTWKLFHASNYIFIYSKEIMI